MSAPTLSEGTRTLPVMPVGQQAALDPYMALEVARIGVTCGTAACLEMGQAQGP